MEFSYFYLYKIFLWVECSFFWLLPILLLYSHEFWLILELYLQKWKIFPLISLQFYHLHCRHREYLLRMSHLPLLRLLYHRVYHLKSDNFSVRGMVVNLKYWKRACWTAISNPKSRFKNFEIGISPSILIRFFSSSLYVNIPTSRSALVISRLKFPA